MDINDLIKALRSKTSRDNRELLDDAADVIELLYRMRDKEALSEEFKRHAEKRTVEDAGPYNGEWISTAERLPSETGEYIVVIEGFEKSTTLFYEAVMRMWIDCLDEDPAYYLTSYYKVSHWMEMPKVPGEREVIGKSEE